MGKAVPPPPEDGGSVEVIDLRSALEERHLAYAPSAPCPTPATG
jgi:hypothetical protein